MIFVIFFYMLIMFVIIMVMSLYFYYYNFSLIFEWLLFSLSSINIEILIYLDWISMLFVSIVMFISSMILIYSFIYMELEIFIDRYYYLVLMFVFSMILMIISPNLISIMFGWDGLGLVSYCLVIYYQNYISYNSGMLTVLMNRLGDVMILMVIGMMFIYGSWNMFMLKKLKYLMILLILAAMTKSAQIPFSSWLPSAMAAPTPVSALVHSSTLVTAGVYLMIRFNIYLMMSMNKWLMMLSILTMFMSGLMANFEFDLKKIIALSTLSQLGLMMMILSIGLPILSFYHLLTHAIFKSLLFMGAGIMIHFMNNNQDIRNSGGLNEFIPFTMMSFHLSLLSLSGFPFLSGFYSKDLIMEFIYLSNFNMFMFLLSIVSLMFTVMYSIRLSYYVYFGEMKMVNFMLIKESKLMNYSMILLMILSIIIGSLLNWMFFYEMVFLSIKMKMLTFVMLIFGLIFLFVLSFMKFMKLYYFSFFCSTMWFMNYLFMYLIKPILEFSYEFYKFDKIWMEFYSKMFFVNLMKEYKNNFISYKYKSFMFFYWFIFMILLMYVY